MNFNGRFPKTASGNIPETYGICSNLPKNLPIDTKYIDAKNAAVQMIVRLQIKFKISKQHTINYDKSRSKLG